MDREKGGRQKGSGVAIIAIILLLLPLLYVLSLGPAIWIADRIGSEPLTDVLQIVYFPLVWLHENTPLREPLEWYVGYWE